MVPFTKLQANGNDFILVEFANIGSQDLINFSRSICDRHYGVGSDGLILLDSSSSADTKMIFYNPDGTKDICGNGMRCVARYLYNSSPFESLTIETDNGTVSVSALSEGSKFCVLMQPPSEILDLTLKSEIGEFTGTLIQVGTPHLVIQRKYISPNLKISEIGKVLENHKDVSEPINIDLISVKNEREIYIEIWERGVGETLSCGTAACASVIAANRKGLISSTCSVISKGGSLEVEWKNESSLSLTGPAEITFAGNFKFEKFK